MKDLSLIGKISIVSGIFFASYGLLLFIKDMKEKSTLINFLDSSGLIALGISIFLSAFFYKKRK
ncbi:hypothetical protein [Bacillus smithii]|mgnify:FL=1|uniref:hypothetical protein n=1 Tax=Bacillus smithii TaxID=1479 RepID=UPI000671A808|nr:hypothetical protein BSM4216_0379 [Bacillus smithii]